MKELLYIVGGLAFSFTILSLIPGWLFALIVFGPMAVTLLLVGVSWLLVGISWLVGD